MIDTHCHLDMPKFAHDRAAVIVRSEAAGVDRWIIPAVSPATARAMLDAPWRTAAMHPAVGIHPHEVKNVTPAWYESLEEMLLTRDGIVGVGEAGIDYFYDIGEAAEQIPVLERHFALAERFSLPLILHVRDGEARSAYADALALVRSAPKSRGVFHSFTGTLADALAGIELGWYIGINGIVTFKRSTDLQAVVRELPVDRILLETDSPYLAPIPHRGRRNEPAWITDTLRFVAALKGMAADELAVCTNRNAAGLFRLTNFA